jgi:tRNA(Ile)-lysidine synthase TilS/MesJ
MLNKFEKKVADFIKKEGLFSGGGNILLAVSGGADSIALLYTMLALSAFVYDACFEKGKAIKARAVLCACEPSVTRECR